MSDEIKQSPKNSKLITYIVGFLLSVLLTIVAYILVMNKLLSGQMLLVTILELAIIQLLVQVIFFLHLGNETGPRWNLVSFITTIALILVIVVGSIWIMNHLNYIMSPNQMEKQIIKDEGMHK